MTYLFHPEAEAEFLAARLDPFGRRCAALFNQSIPVRSRVQH